MSGAFLENADGSRVCYQTLGEGRAPWITLINGYTRAWTDFRSMAKRWTESGFSVLACDNRGAGQTTVAGPFTLDDIASDVIGLWDHLGIASSSVLGISMRYCAPSSNRFAEVGQSAGSEPGQPCFSSCSRVAFMRFAARRDRRRGR